MQLVNYIITIIWEIVLPNSLFQRLLHFSVIYERKENANDENIYLEFLGHVKL